MSRALSFTLAHAYTCPALDGTPGTVVVLSRYQRHLRRENTAELDRITNVIWTRMKLKWSMAGLIPLVTARKDGAEGGGSAFTLALRACLYAALH